MASHTRNCAGARVYHKTGENPKVVTIRYSRPPTMARPELGGIVTILHGRPPTTKTAKITKIVTILHSPKPAGLCALTHKTIMSPCFYASMRICSLTHKSPMLLNAYADMRIKALCSYAHKSMPPGSATVRMRIIIIPRAKMKIILTKKNSTKALIQTQPFLIQT